MKKIIILLIAFLLLVGGPIFGYEYLNPTRYIIQYTVGDFKYENTDSGLGCDLLKGRFCTHYRGNYTFFGPTISFPVKVDVEYGLSKVGEQKILTLLQNRNDIINLGKGDWNQNNYYIGEKTDGSYAIAWGSGRKLVFIESFGQVENNDFFEDLLTDYLAKYPSDISRN